MDPATESWIRAHVEPSGAIETTHERPWATVLRVPLADGVAWFKACAPVQAFEPRLTAELFARWPDRVTEVLGHDDGRGWLLLADAGTPIRELGNPPEAWLAALPLYAELQRGEAAHTHDHVAHGIPDLRVVTLPTRYEQLLQRDLPLERDEIARLRAFSPRFAELCDELGGRGIPETVQHDDLHMANLYACGERLRLLDWGDASISHPFTSLVVTFRFLEEINELPPTDPWFARLRDAYLEPWGNGLVGTFSLALRVGVFAHTVAWARQRDHLPEEARPASVAFNGTNYLVAWQLGSEVIGQQRAICPKPRNRCSSRGREWVRTKTLSSARVRRRRGAHARDLRNCDLRNW